VWHKRGSAELENCDSFFKLPLGANYRTKKRNSMDAWAKVAPVWMLTAKDEESTSALVSATLLRMKEEDASRPAWELAWRRQFSQHFYYFAEPWKREHKECECYPCMATTPEDSSAATIKCSEGHNVCTICMVGVATSLAAMLEAKSITLPIDFILCPVYRCQGHLQIPTKFTSIFTDACNVTLYQNITSDI
jgi:hypothetical protein